jgi:uncharacterized membrane protein
MSQLPESFPAQQQRIAGCLVFALLLFTICLLPLIFVDLAQTALRNLHLSPQAAVLVIVALVFGSFINIPVARFPLDREVLVPVFDPVVGWPGPTRYRRLRQEAIVAVNVGGCVIPVLLSLWLLRFIGESGVLAVTVTALGVCINTVVCYQMARPIPGLGIAMSPFISPATALACTWLGFPLLSGLLPAVAVHADFGDVYAPVAFVIGVSGPLLGADLLHWKDFKKLAAGSISIGGAGTWDGIVLSGLLAALLA